MSPLHSGERRALLELARRAMVSAVQHGRELVVPTATGALNHPMGVFVTLRRRGRLRGCVGQVETPEPLAQVVARCAVAAAVEDPRFEPVRLAELPDLEIEISILSRLAVISPEQIEPGRHGLMVTRGGKRGVLLPQVATEYHWSRETFLEETCVKGGFDREAWRDPATRIEAFTAEVFSEGEIRLQRQTRAG